MKEITVDIGDVTLHKEVYDSRPNKFFAIFIYSLLAMILIAGTWAFFGHIDIVVRATGVIRPSSQIATVTNAVSGEVREVFFYDGMRVEQGDILYIIDSFHLENELLVLDERLGVLEHELASLNLYMASIEEGQNLVGGFNHELSARLDSFLLNLSAMEHDVDTQMGILQAELTNIQETLSNTHLELTALRALELSIASGSNRFGEFTFGAGARGIETRNTYQSLFFQYMTEMSNFEFLYINTSASLQGLTALKNSVELGENLFVDEHGVYQGMFNEHILHLGQLQERYEIAIEEVRIHTMLFEIGDISRAELQSRENVLELTRFEIDSYMSGLMLGLDNQIRDTQNRLTSIENQREVFHLDTVVSIGNQLLQLENTSRDLEQRAAQNRLRQDSLFLADDELGDVTIVRLNELNATLSSISTTEQEISRLQASRSSIVAQIEESTVRAQISGEINAGVELISGIFLMSGVTVLTIMPERDDVLTANIFVSNNDIGNIAEGLAVQFDIPALPRRDFGAIYGYITRISPDIAADDGIQGFFIAESELADVVYYDTRGNSSELRVGMSFEARIVTDRQRILFFLLDRVNLLFR